MTAINSGIKQPLRFYDSPLKQNWRRCWVHGSGFNDVNTVICPVNTIIPFQIRRRRSPLPVTVFDLYTWDAASESFVWDMNLFTILDPSDTVGIIQMQQADNIVWYPLKSFIADMACGLHYIAVGDNTTVWYSEVFRAVDFNSEVKISASVLAVAQNIDQTSAIKWTNGGDTYEIIFGRKTV